MTMNLKWLERALVFTLLAHVAASLAMGLVLLPGMPGGPNAAPLARAAFMAAHPIAWRIGFFFWHAVSASDLLLSLALLGASWRAKRLPAALALLGTLAALAFEQPAEILWQTRMMDLAREAVAGGDAAPFAAQEAALYALTAAWSTLAWSLTAICWSWGLAKLGIWRRGLTWFSAGLWGLFLLLGLVPLAPPTLVPPAAVVAGNVVGFAAMVGWFAWVTELALRHARPTTDAGHWKVWRHPGRGLGAHALNLIANSRLLRLLGGWLPAVSLASDIRDVVYVNYLVEAEKLAPLVPKGLALDRIGPGGRFAVCSVLAFRHGHYGPRCLGLLRRKIAWSPLQANWRVYVREPGTGELGVFFLATAITSLPYALAARKLAEGVSMHMPARASHARASHARETDGRWTGAWLPGAGSCPDLRFDLRQAAQAPLPETWRECFGTFQGLLDYLVPVEQTFAVQPWRTLRQSIRLDMARDACVALDGEVHSVWLAPWIGPAAPLCFGFEEVGFLFTGETSLPRTETLP